MKEKELIENVQARTSISSINDWVNRRFYNVNDEDVSLVEKILADAHQAFDELWRKYGPRIERHAKRILFDQSDAEDCRQEVLIRILRGLDKFRFRTKFSSWVSCITRHCAINIIRKKIKTKTQHLEGDEVEQTGGSAISPQKMLEYKDQICDLIELANLSSEELEAIQVELVWKNPDESVPRIVHIHDLRLAKSKMNDAISKYEKELTPDEIQAVFSFFDGKPHDERAKNLGLRKMAKAKQQRDAAVSRLTLPELSSNERSNLLHWLKGKSNNWLDVEDLQHDHCESAVKKLIRLLNQIDLIDRYIGSSKITDYEKKTLISFVNGYPPDPVLPRALVRLRMIFDQNVLNSKLSEFTKNERNLLLNFLADQKTVSDVKTPAEKLINMLVPVHARILNPVEISLTKSRKQALVDYLSKKDFDIKDMYEAVYWLQTAVENKSNDDVENSEGGVK